ncbi:MAG: HEAT repeat domain-containing protein [Candidatus Methanoperedens sp.]
MVYQDKISELSKDTNIKNRRYAAHVFRYFPDFPDKKEAWADLHRLTQDEDSIVRQKAAHVFRYFPDFPDKKEAWADLHRLTQDEDSVVRQTTAFAFRLFSDFPDKREAWADLHRLTQDDDSIVRQNAARAFISFSDFPDKKEAWADLHRLTQDEDSIVRQNAAVAFTSFSDFPDKREAWADLHRLTQDEDSVVRQNTAFIIHPIYEKVPQKEKLLEWLSNLKEDSSNRVRAASYYSLARIYVYESLKVGTEQGFNENYNKAIQFFKEAYSYQQWNITEFCFTVHSLFYKILSGDIENVDDIRKNISRLKNRHGKSEERKYLIEFVESLGNVLEESLIAKKSGKDAWKYREKVLPICNRMDELIKILKHQGIREIAKKAKDKVEDEYSNTVKLLNKVNYLINTPEQLEEQFLPTLKGFCELFPEPEIRDKIKQDLNNIQKESDPNIRIRLEIQQLKYIQLMLEMDLKSKEREIKHRDEIIDIKDKESGKGWNLLKSIRPKEISEFKGIGSKPIAIKILESLGISFTISGVIWGIIYAFLIEKKYPTAMRDSLVAASIFLILIFLIYFIKKR